MLSHKTYDVIVAGLGAMGSATAAQLALRGKKVLGLDRWIPGHTFGSSHGDSRIIREMYFEHPMYVPLLKRAYELWADLEKRVDQKLLNIYGGLMIGRQDGMLVAGTLRSAKEHHLDHEVLSPAEVKKRYPAFDLDPDLVAVVDPRAGWLDPEQCNAAHLNVAAHHGADLRFEEPVIAWTADESGVSVTTSHASYAAEHLVLAVGARTRVLLEDLKIPLEIERQVVFWMTPPDGSRYDRSQFPIWAYEYKPGHICYGFPQLPFGVKASVMHGGEIYDYADEVNRVIRDDEEAALKEAIKPVLPSLAESPVRDSTTCLFTNTPDHDFIIDFHADYPRVLISSACSGHGFKFASVVGEIQADMVVSGRSAFDLSPFRLSRFLR
ncbi:MAG TPA: N-methyl-L-tryptophan oxidase [Gemmatimonadaceae bacterium]